MTLRTDYNGALDTALLASRAAGKTWVITTNSAAITTALVAAGTAGKKVFTFTAGADFQPADLKLLGTLFEAHKTGILQGLAEQDVMNNEVTVSLNTAYASTVKIDLYFTF